MTRPTPTDADVDPALLKLLLEADRPLTIDDLARGLHRSSSWVSRELEPLRAAGCEIEHRPDTGYRLRQSGLGVWVDHLRSELGADRAIEIYRQTASTQDAARRMIAARGELADGGLVVAHEQTSGRGRLGRTWISEPGRTLTLSRVCKSRIDKDGGTDRLTFIAAVACARALDQWTAGRVGPVAIKWPNDLMLGAGKLGGILVESFYERAGQAWSVLGVGINVAPPTGELDRPIAALAETIDAAPDRLRVLTAVARSLDSAISGDDNASELLEQWRSRCRTLNQELWVRAQGQELVGTVIDLDPDAGLILRGRDGVVRHLPAETTTVL